MSVNLSDIFITLYAEFNGSHILQTENASVAVGTDDHVLIVWNLLISSSVFEYIAEGVLRLHSECSCRGFNVLLIEDCLDVGRHQVVFRHLSRIQPDTERVVRSAHIDFSDSCDTGKPWLDVDSQVVGDEFAVKAVVRAIYGESLDAAGLTFSYCHTAFCYFGRKLALC